MGARRDAVVAAARRWIGTPFRHAARVRGPGGGVDCGQLLIAVFAEAGLYEPPAALPAYSPDWYLHRAGCDHFTPILRAVAAPLAAPAPPGPGDIACFQFGRAAQGHAAIVTAWPLVVHADAVRGVVEQGASVGLLAGRYAGAWRLTALEDAAA
jgi:cell wall-associated NlpC family hydrolase